jgi:hypothetical protein
MISKKTLLRAAWCALLGTLAGCGGSDSGSSDSNSATNSATNSNSSATALVALTSSSYTAAPSTAAVISIYRTGSSVGAASAGYTTVNGTATAGADYVATSGTVTWSDGDSSVKTVSVPVTSAASGKSFAVALTSVAGQASFGSPTSATVDVSGASSGVAALPSGDTMIPSATKIADSEGNIWTLNGGVVYENGKTAGFSANVIVLLYYGGTIYQENQTCLWWSWNGSTWVAESNPDPAAIPACGSSAAAATLPGTVPAPTGVVGVQVSGNKLLSTQDGSVVHLRGVNLAGFDQGSKPWIDYACFGGCTPSSGNSEPNFAYLAQLHFNAVRIPLIQENWLGYACYTGSAVHPTATNTTPNAAMFQAALIKTVADATAAGLYVILDLHWSAPNDPNTGVPYCSFGQGAAADADHSIDFWISIANTFKNNPAVLFELYNEPFLSSCYDKGGTNPAGIACSLVQSTWTTGDGAIFRNGGTYYPFIHQVNGSGLDVLNITWHVAGMQDLVNGIRTTGTFTASNGKQFTGAGAKNVILSASIGWNQNINLWPEFAPSDPTGQLAASWHVYSFSGADNLQSATVVATGNCNANSGAVPDCGSGVPIVITEFQAGFGNNLSSQNNKVANWSDSTSGGSGYMYWAFVPWGNYGDDGIETAACGTGTYPLFANGGTCGALTNQGKLFATGVACAVQGDDCWANVN